MKTDRIDSGPDWGEQCCLERADPSNTENSGFHRAGAGNGGRLRALAAAAGLCCAGGRRSALGCAVVALGCAIYFHTAFWGFAMIGGGTPAPIAPPKTLVVRGLHRFVRNPMYIGVLLIITGQAWLFWSRSLFLYVALLWSAFHLFVLIYEEPTLQKEFGESYKRYRAGVPRWIPRIRL